ncbi:hypothetical protein PF003_g20070 [Phytophthora fragariae]|nr:hypothetical protein PF003_g20070 [Phytophthora fragariae]
MLSGLYSGVCVLFVARPSERCFAVSSQLVQCFGNSVNEFFVFCHKVHVMTVDRIRSCCCCSTTNDIC